MFFEYYFAYFVKTFVRDNDSQLAFTTVDCRLLFPGQKPNQIYIWSFTFTKLPCCNLEFNISLVRFVLVILRRYILVITFSLKKVFFFSRWRAWKWFQPGPCVFHAQRHGGFPAISRIFLFFSVGSDQRDVNWSTDEVSAL